MAKQSVQEVVTTKDVAVVPAAALANVAASALAVREGADASDNRGKENIDGSDLRLPRIAIAQRTSPEILEGEERYIPGLKFTELFNTLTRESYGTGPITFVPLGLRKHAMVFDDNNKAVEFDVPLDDERLQFGADGEKPTATLFYEFLGLIVKGDDQPELALLSLKGTGIRTAQDFATLMRTTRGPVWERKYLVSTTKKDFPKGPAGVFKIMPNGATTAEVAAFADAMYESTKGRKIVTDIDAPESGDDDL